MKKIIAAVLLVALAGGGVFYFKHKDKVNNVDDAYYANVMDLSEQNVTGYNLGGTPGKFNIDYNKYSIEAEGYIKILVNGYDDILEVQTIEESDIPGDAARTKLGIN